MKTIVTWHKQWLANRFAEIGRKLDTVIAQLDDEQVNWRPNARSNSIANLVVHMRGSMQARVEAGIFHKTINRDRELEFAEIWVPVNELREIVNQSFGFLAQTVQELSEDRLAQVQTIKTRDVTNLEVLHSCEAHYSEHAGQVVYIAKSVLNDRYVGG